MTKESFSEGEANQLKGREADANTPQKPDVVHELNRISNKLQSLGFLLTREVAESDIPGNHEVMNGLGSILEDLSTSIGECVSSLVQNAAI